MDVGNEVALQPIRTIEQRVGRKKSWIYAGVAAGTFPKPAIKDPRNLWLSDDITQWIGERVAQARQAAA